MHPLQRSARILKRGEKKDAEPAEQIKFKDVLTFPLAFWLVCLICVAFYVTIFPFIGACLGVMPYLN